MTQGTKVRTFTRNRARRSEHSRETGHVAPNIGAHIGHEGPNIHDETSLTCADVTTGHEGHQFRNFPLDSHYVRRAYARTHQACRRHKVRILVPFAPCQARP